MASFASVYAANRTTFVGAGAAVVIAIAAVIGLRNRAPTVQVVAASPDAAGAAGGVSFGEISSAYGAGASAASSGLGVGSDLGQAALGLAGNVVSSQAYVAQALAGSQADVAEVATTDFASVINALIGAGRTIVPPPPTVVYTFAPTPTTAPTTTTAPKPTTAPTTTTAPAPAPVGHVVHFAPGARVRSYVVSSRGCISSWTDHTWDSTSSKASCGAAYHLNTCAGTSGATVVRVSNGEFAGHVIALGNGVTYT